MPRFAGLLSTMLFVLAVMVFWGFLIRSWAAKNPNNAVAQGLLFNVG